MQTIVVANQKGGVGKSTLTALLAWHFAEQSGHTVAALDLDNQRNLSKTLGKYATPIGSTAFWREEPLSLEAPGDALALFSGEADLVDLERGSPTTIRTFCQQIEQLASHYTHCLIDTPPTLGLRLSGALIAADFVLCPVELEEYSLDGLKAMLQTVLGIRQQYNPSLKLLGVLANRFNGHSLRQKETLRALVSQYADYMLPAKISNRSAIPEALAMGIPVWRLDKSSAREASLEVLRAFALIEQVMEGHDVNLRSVGARAVQEQRATVEREGQAAAD
jgi:chromosome partitioning protein